MKKIVIFLIAILSLNLAACGKTEGAKTTNDGPIGTVGVESSSDSANDAPESETAEPDIQLNVETESSSEVSTGNNTASYIDPAPYWRGDDYFDLFGYAEAYNGRYEVKCEDLSDDLSKDEIWKITIKFHTRDGGTNAILAYDLKGDWEDYIECLYLGNEETFDELLVVGTTYDMPTEYARQTISIGNNFSIRKKTLLMLFDIMNDHIIEKDGFATTGICPFYGTTTTHINMSIKREELCPYCR